MEEHRLGALDTPRGEDGPAEHIEPVDKLPSCLTTLSWDSPAVSLRELIGGCSPSSCRLGGVQPPAVMRSPSRCSARYSVTDPDGSALRHRSDGNPAVPLRNRPLSLEMRAGCVYRADGSGAIGRVGVGSRQRRLRGQPPGRHQNTGGRQPQWVGCRATQLSAAACLAGLARVIPDQ